MEVIFLFFFPFFLRGGRRLGGGLGFCGSYMYLPADDPLCCFFFLGLGLDVLLVIIGMEFEDCAFLGMYRRREGLLEEGTAGWAGDR